MVRADNGKHAAAYILHPEIAVVSTHMHAYPLQLCDFNLRSPLRMKLLLGADGEVDVVLRLIFGNEARLRVA